jgi:hypothetical protein
MQTGGSDTFSISSYHKYAPTIAFVYISTGVSTTAVPIHPVLIVDDKYQQ